MSGVGECHLSEVGSPVSAYALGLGAGKRLIPNKTYCGYITRTYKAAEIKLKTRDCPPVAILLIV